MRILNLYRIAALGLMYLPQTAFSAPTLPDPGGKTESPFTAINCDYGPRNFRNQKERDSNPHKGIDYDIKDDAKGWTVEEGAVGEVRLAGSLSHISIGDWYYIHIATSSQFCSVYGSAELDPDNVVVLRELVAGKLRIKSILGRETGIENASFFDPITKATEPITTYVSSETWVFLAHPAQRHLHLQYLHGAKNPLEYVLHKDDNDPVAVLWPKVKQIGGNGLASDITSDIIYSTAAPLILQAGVDVTGDKDLNEVVISVSSEGASVPMLFNRWSYEPELGNVRKKFVSSTRWQAGEIFASSMVPIASASKEGIYPQFNVVSFDFLKFKWDTRAPSSTEGLGYAFLNSLALYPDGKYVIHIGARDITGHEVGTETVKTLDNFRPYVESVEVRDLLDNVKYRREWTFNGDVLTSDSPESDEPLLPGGEYKSIITFSELMEHSEFRLGSLGPIYFPAGTIHPEMQKTVYTGNFLVPGGLQRDELRPFLITGKDSAGNPGWNDTLELAPGKREGDGRTEAERMIDPLYELVRDGEGLMRGTGGEDRFHSLRIDAAPPEVSWPDRQRAFSGSCLDGTPERCGSEAAPYNINFNTVLFRYADFGSGLKELKIYKNNLSGELFKSIALSEPKRYFSREVEMTIPDGKYAQVVTDNLGRATTIYFRIDPVTPRLQISSIAMSTDFSTYTVYGVVIDTGSGMDYLHLSRANTSIADFSLVSGSTGAVNYSFSGLSVGGDEFYALTAQDKAQNTTPQPLLKFSRTGPGYPSPGDFQALVHYVTEVYAQGGPCSISVTSNRNTFIVPVNYEIGAGTITALLTENTATAITVASPRVYIHGDIKINVSQNCSLVNGENHCVDACSAWLKGNTVIASVIGPAVAISRYSASPSRFNLTMKLFMADFTFEDAEWDAGSPPAVNAGENAPPQPPKGFVNYPPDLPRGWQIETRDLHYGQLSIKAYGLPESMSDGDKSSIRMMKYHNGVASDITTGFEGNAVSGVTHDTSLFTLVAPLGMYDKQGPVTRLSLSTGEMYISTATALRFSAVDLSSNSYAVAGVATTYYLIDVAATPDCLAVQYNPDAPQGTCSNSVFSGAFTLNEGSHTLYAMSVDKIGNYGGNISSSVYVDGTAPVTSITVRGALLAAGGTAYIAAMDRIMLTAQDIVSNGVDSGPAASYMLIDISPEECEYAEGIGGIDGMGSCENSFYPGPFSLPAGEHVIYYHSEDNVGNRESFKTAYIIVDAVPPIITARINGQIIADSATVSITSTDTITLNAEDAGSGLLAKYYTIDAEFSTTAATTYTAPFSLLAGTHTVYYGAVDNVGNVAAVKSVTVNVERAVSVNFYPAVKSVFSVLWQWELVEGATGYRVFSSTGGAVSPVLPGTTTAYLQSKLLPNILYSNRLVVYRVDGVYESEIVNAVTLANTPISVESFVSGQSASIVIGQPGFYTNSFAAGPTGLWEPAGVAMDAGGNMWVADRSNYRVLRFSPPFFSGMSADLVIGQTSLYLSFAPGNLYLPESLAFDRAGNLWVADGGRNRILRFSPPFSTGMDANLVLGSPDHYVYPSPQLDKRLGGSPLHIAFDSHDNLWISDGSNNRVLRFLPPFINNMSADLVVGQADLFSRNAVYSPPNNTSLASPTGIAVDSEDNLWVADLYNARVLKFEKPDSNGQAAALVIGQPNFDSNYWPTFSAPPSQNQFIDPMALSFDPLGNLFVLESGNNRILRFKPPFANGMNADTVIGQSNFTSRVAGTTPSNFNGLWQADLEISGFVFTDSHGRMWVSDTYNNRVLLFESGKGQTFSQIGSSSFTIKWDHAFNPGTTLYQAEISAVSDFSAGVTESGYVNSIEYTFTGLQPGTLYYARVKAKNLDGIETAYDYPGSMPTSPEPASGFTGTARSSVSIEWGWIPPPQYSGYQVFNSTGGPVSGVLEQGASRYLQTGLSPNATYTCYVRSVNKGGFSDSAPALVVTHAAVPVMASAVVTGQNADIVLGQNDFNSAVCSSSMNGLCGASDVVTDGSGNVWVVDRFNDRILEYEPPFIPGKNAALVLNGYNYRTKITFDSEGHLWVSDYWNNRVLMFNQPFATGMNADLVLGQTDFNSSSSGDTPNKFSSPSAIAFDPAGNLWVADSAKVKRFSPPFANGMSANLSFEKYVDDLSFDTSGNMWVTQGANKVLKFVPPFSADMTVSLAVGADTWEGHITLGYISRAGGVALDGSENLYVVDMPAARILLFRPPFSGVDASAVLGGEWYAPRINSLAQPVEVSIGADKRIWVADTGNNRVVGYTMTPFVEVGSNVIVMKWQDMVNPVATQYRVEASKDVLFSSIAAQSEWLDISSFTIGGLDPGTQYYVRLKARNKEQIEGEPLYLGGVGTLAGPALYARSGALINGSPEVSIKSPQQMSISLPSEGTESLRIAIASAVVQNLIAVGNIYEVGPDGEYNPPALLTFHYSTSAVAALDVQESELAVYEYFVGTGWVKLAGQTLDTVNKKITVPINRVASLFGIFIESIDLLAPVTNLTLEGAEDRLFQSGAAEIYINSKSYITLSAHDPVFRGMASGVAFTEYRVDPDTSTPFSVYSLPFTLSTGFHTIEYRSRDNAGNLEVLKSTAVYADSVTPVTELLLTGTTGQNGWHVSTGTVVLISTDIHSGVSGVYYKVLRNGDLPPAATNYLLYSSPVEFNGEGEYFLYYYAEDNTGNIEAHKSTAFKLDLTTPTATYTSFPAPNPDSWNNVPVSVTFTGTDAVSGIEYCSSSFTLSGEGLGIPVSGYCADYAGWTSTVSFSVNIDTTAPSSNAEIAAEQGLNGWLLSPVGIMLTSTDSLSGTAGLYYAVDGSSFALYSSSFAVNGEGAHLLKYYALDKAGNKEAERELAFKLDLNSPIVSAVPGPAANTYGWNNTAVAVVFSGTDTISGLAYCEPEKIVETEGSSWTVTGYCSDYAGRSSTVSLTVSVDTTAPNLSYTPEPLANQVGWNNSDVALKFACSDSLSGVKSCPADILLASEGINISTSGAAYDYAGNSGYILVSGIKIDKTAPISTAAVSGVYENGWYSSPVTLVLASTDSLSGLKGIMYSLDVGGYSEYTQPVVVSSEGNHVLSYYSEDLAGNIESARTIDFAIDTTAPMADYLLSPPANPVGWNSSAVNVLFRGNDTLSGIVDCSSVAVAVEGKDQKVTGWCRDLAGNIAYATATLNIDLTAPLVSVVQVPERNASGWNNGPVEINFAGADALSGIAYCEPVKIAAVAGASQTVTGYCMDYAGLSSTATYIISIDTAAPLLVYSRTPANTDGWNNSDVTVNFDCSDDLSGIGYCPGSIMYPAEGINISTSVRTWDLAGNNKDSTVNDINIDKTAPVSTAAVSGIHRNGWYSSTVEIVLGSTDALSGVKEIYYSLDSDDYVSYQQLLSVNSDGPHEVKYYAVDKAGNIETMGKAGFKIDRHAPAISHILNPEFNAAGWNNSAVLVVFTGTDAVSGVEECSSGNITLEGTGQEIAGWCRDLAGNISYTTAAVNIDLTVPLASVSQTPERNAYGWNNTPVTAMFVGTDAVSGIAYCSSAALLETEGSSHTLAGYCADYAGWSSTVSLTVNIDTTAPSLAYTMDHVANGAGWNNSDVLLKFTCADGLSGVKACPADITLTGEGVNISTSAAAFDLADNIRHTTATFNIDRTPPVITISSPAAGQVFIATRGDIGVKFGVTDNLDPAPVFVAWLEQVEDRGSPRGARPARLAVANGQSIDPLDIDDGSWRLTVSATDFADNAALLSDGIFEVIHDVLAPRTGQTITVGPSLTVGATTYITSAARLELTSIDNLVSANDGIGLGVKDQSIRVKSGGSLVKELLFANPSPKQGEAFISSFTGAGLDVADGVYSLAYNASDVLGNIETEKSVLIGLDNTAPASSAEIAGTAGGNGWHISTVTISLMAMDALSGVAGISYGLDSGAYMAYTNPVEIATEGQRTVRFYAGDRLGNTEAGKSVDFKIDRTPPVVIATITPAANAADWHNGTVKAGFSGSDAVSGIAYCEPAGTMRDEGRGLELSGYCRDQAGLTSTATARFNIDLTSPTVIIERAPLANLRGWNNTDVKVAFTCGDALSSIKSCPSAATLAGEGAGQGVSGTAVDYADNISSASMGGINIDKTTPASSLSISGVFWESGSDKYLNPRSAIALAATDGLSGVEAMEYHVDEAPFGVYSSSFSLAEGMRAVHYRAIDKADNTEAARTALYRVDGASPATFLKVIGGIQHPAPEPGIFYASLASRFTLEAVDPVTNGVASGVRQTSWSDNGGAISYAIEGLAFAEGRHVLAYSSIDNVNNLEVAGSTTILVDNTPPLTTHHIGSPYHAAGGVDHITPATPITFTAEDPVSGGVHAGVSRIEVSLDGSAFSAYTAALKFSEGRHTIKYRAVDNVGNVEAERILEVQSDNTAPVSTWSAASGDRIERGNKFYLNALGRIAFESADPVISDVASGVEGIYYGIDAAPADKYAVPIGLEEGIRLIKFSAKDNVGNTEVVKSTVIYVDGTKPITVLSVSGDQYKSERQYISRRTDIVIAATDPVVNEVSVGVKETKYAVDGAAFSDYSQFKLDAEGRRLVSFYSADHVNNVEVAKTAELWVDGTAPLSVLNILGGKQYPGADPGSFYASLATKFGIVSVDPVVSDGAAGVKAIEYADNGGTSVVYAQPISLGEGKHLITYWAIDRVENTEVFRSTQIHIDNTAPVTSFNITEPLYIQDGVRYITPVSALTFSAIDPLTKEVAAGVERIETAVDGGQWLKYTQALKFAEGRHTIKYRAIDNVGNTEAGKTLELRSDNTPPVSKWRVNSGDSVELGGRFYLNAQGKITLESADPVVAEVTSGLEGIYYGINTAPAGKYSAPLGLAEGIRTVNFSARDNVGNTEVAKSTVIYVDGTGPVSGLTLTGEQYHGDKVHISARTGIVITSVDPIVNEVASGLKETKYSVDGGVFVNYSLFRLSAEGKRLVSYYSADYVANTEMVKTAALWVDNTPPSTELTVAGARYTAPGDGKLYITGDSGIVLTSWDSISNDTASGLLLTKYRIDNGSWQVYSGSFTVAAEGPHTLEYYALDRVQNAEPLKTIYLAVDNTPPAAVISFGGPGAEAFSLPLLTPSAKITLSALDPVVNGAASGLNSIFYELNNIQTGALTPVTAYLSPFTMPGQGTFSIRYWSKDNTGNIEAPKEQIAAVTTWLEDGLATVSGLEMSGTADISGAVKSNAMVSLAGNARILGDVTASTITLTGKAQITGLQVLRSPSIDPVPIILDGIIQSAQATNKNDLVAGYLAAGKLVLGSKAGITLTTGTYYFKGMELSGGSSITIAGKVDIVVEGGIAINGGSSVNASGAASSLTIIVSTSSELKFSGGAALAARVYAPYSELKLAGNALLGGHYFVKRAVLSGAGNILQAGEVLPVAAASPGGGPKTKAAAMASGGYSVLAGPDPAFRLGEVYVFPNPAKGGEAPVFHVETGLADTVKITIYTISGRAAHEQTLTGMPAELDDGNGLSYAYEYVWRGHIPSGVYLYYIEAQKAGQKLKKTGKFSVVR